MSRAQRRERRMPQTLIKASDNGNRPILPGGKAPVPNTYFNLLKTAADQEVSLEVPGFETCLVVMSGTVDIRVGSAEFANVGRRRSIWDGPADSVYAGTGAKVTVRGRSAAAEVAVAGGRCEGAFAPFRITPEETEPVDVGSTEQHCHRRIVHVLGHNGVGRAGRLLVSELYCEAGNWSGYPPHKHGEDAGAAESAHEEIYHYRFRPENGFGAQYWYLDGQDPTVHRTRSGDTFAFMDGFHPTVTSPGHEEYIFTVLVGSTQRSLVQNFEPQYRHLMKLFPGVQAMIDKFK